MKKTYDQFQAEQQEFMQGRSGWTSKRVEKQGGLIGSSQASTGQNGAVRDSGWNKPLNNPVIRDDDIEYFEKPPVRIITDEMVTRLIRSHEIDEELRKPHTTNIVKVGFNFDVERARELEQQKQQIAADIEQYYSREKAMLREAHSARMSRQKQQEEQSTQKGFFFPR